MRLRVSVVAILLFVPWGLLRPQSMVSEFDQALAGVTVNFGWLYLWVVLGLVVFALLLAFGRYGSLKLGGEEEEEEGPARAARFYAPLGGCEVERETDDAGKPYPQRSSGGFGRA